MFNVRIQPHTSSIQHILERMRKRQELEDRLREEKKERKKNKPNE